MNIAIVRLKTYWQLGIANIFTVAIYRIVKELGLFEKLLPIDDQFEEGFFFINNPKKTESTCLLGYFSHQDIEVSSPPDWLKNPYNGKSVTNNFLHWSKHPDFNPELGDIKMVWEASRFDWLPKFAWQSKNGNTQALSKIENWLQNWVKKNPVNQGINWKCGQEASFRCLNLMVALVIIDFTYKSPTTTVRSFLFQHLTRISLTLRYAMAQDNNHGTSEASALFIVGHYLELYGNNKQKLNGVKWAKQGRYWLENRVKHLVMKDGSFSQNSIVYHRLLLDTLSITELFRRKLNASPFSDLLYQRAELASMWLFALTDPISGDAPNLGCNDGAYLFNLDGAKYRDFRPSIELACNLFLNKVAYTSVIHPLSTVFPHQIEKTKQVLPSPTNILFDKGGYIRLIGTNKSYAVLRLPLYYFRPSDADALHLDIWHNGINVLRDAGTYSYNAEKQYLLYFPGTISHNTITFDEHDQMPRLSRFLFGGWLQSKKFRLDNKASYASASYCDKWGACHKRTVSSRKNGWRVTDTISGFKQTAVLRWNLPNDNWKINNDCLIGSSMKIRIQSDNQINISLKKRWESLYYGEKHKMPMLEITCMHGSSIQTDIKFI